MGFYGNILNASKTDLSFDLIYPNRKTLEEKCLNDGVYLGRRVLVEYSNNILPVRQGYMKDKSATPIILYRDSSCATPFLVTEDSSDGYGLQLNDIVYYDDTVVSGSYLYYYCTSSQPDGTALFTLLKESETNSLDDDYTLNYNIDKKWAESQSIPIKQGWDSTIWEKVAANGGFKYRLIGKLNSDLPEFSVAYDPPTMVPVPPHLDNNGTNNHYNMHYQPSWSFRVRSAYNIQTPKLDDKGEVISNQYVDASTSGTEIDPDGMTTIWKKPAVDPVTKNIIYKYFSYDEGAKHGTWVEDEASATPVPAAIYFNKAGFNKETISKVQEQDRIDILPTGQSGLSYKSENNELSSPANDVYELSMILPSIGNIMSDIWDLAYGGKELCPDGKRNLNIAWEDASQELQKTGLRLVKKDNSYDPAAMSTMAGCINTMHDLIGMIIVEVETLPDVATASTEKIYYSQTDKKYYRKKKHVPKGGDPAAVTYIFSEIPSFGDTVGTLNGQILKALDMLDTDDPETRDLDTVLGCINALNDLIKVFPTGLTPETVLTVDSNGVIISGDIGTLPLRFYEYHENADPITKDDTVNTAFCKIQTGIDAKLLPQISDTYDDSMKKLTLEIVKGLPKIKHNV